MAHFQIIPPPLYTFSGLLAFGAVVSLLNGWLTPAGLMLTIGGAGGVGVFWERWSQMAGDDVHVAALWQPTWPTVPQWELLVTHLPMLLLGSAIIAAVAWRNRKAGRRRAGR